MRFTCIEATVNFLPDFVARQSATRADRRRYNYFMGSRAFTAGRIAPYSVLMIEYLNQNGGAVTAFATIALLGVTGRYAWITRALLLEEAVMDL